MPRFVPFLLMAATLTAQSNRTACEMTSETATAFRALPAMSDVTMNDVARPGSRGWRRVAP